MQTKLTFLPEDSHANPIHLQASEEARTMNATCGLKCVEQLERFPRVTLWEKTFLALLIGTGDWYSTRCVLTWRLKATRSRPWLYLRRRSMPRTEEIGCGSSQCELLPTPTARDDKNGTTADSQRTQRRLEQGWTIELNDLATMGLLPTPIAQASRGNTSAKRGKGNLTDQIAEMELSDSPTSQLNPRFVAEMMGFPVNWTELPFQSGEPNQ